MSEIFIKKKRITGNHAARDPDRPYKLRGINMCINTGRLGLMFREVGVILRKVLTHTLTGFIKLNLFPFAYLMLIRPFEKLMFSGTTSGRKEPGI